ALRRAGHGRAARVACRGGLWPGRGCVRRRCRGARRARAAARRGRDGARQRLARDGARADRRGSRCAGGRHGGSVVLMHLTERLTHYYSGFNVFNYLTMRAILSALTALVMSLAFGPSLIQRL